MDRRTLFVNLPVSDVARAQAFSASLGFSLPPRLSDDETGCVVIASETSLLLLGAERFRSFAPRPPHAPPRTATAALLALSCSDRDEVRRPCEAAFAAGGRRFWEPQDHGFLFSWAFEDPDGHVREPRWMDPAHAVDPA